MFRPRDANQGVFESGWCACERAVDARFVCREGADVVDDQGGVERVGGEVVRRWGK